MELTKDNSEIIVTRTRLYPTKEQYTKLSSHYGANRFAYNHLLASQKLKYETWEKEYKAGNLTKEDRPKVSYRKIRAEWNSVRDTVAPWHKQNNDRPYRSAAGQLEKAYKNFFNGSGFPKFKNRNSKQSFSMEGTPYLIDDRHIHIAKIGDVKTKERLKGVAWLIKMGSTIQDVTVTREPDGKDYVSIRLRVHKSVAIMFLRGRYVRKSRGKAGLDVGIEKYGQLSDGNFIHNPRFLKKYADKLEKEQRKLSKEQEKLKVKRKGDPDSQPNSKYKRAKKKVARTHAKIRRLRENHSWQTARLLASFYELLTVEDLNISEMVKNHVHAKSISEAAWGGFLTKLAYYYDDKRFGGKIVEADRWFASTQTCFKCGAKTKHGVNERTFYCGARDCGFVIDRDLNAALNLLQWGVASRCEETINGPEALAYAKLLVECCSVTGAQGEGCNKLTSHTSAGVEIGFTPVQEPPALLPLPF